MTLTIQTYAKLRLHCTTATQQKINKISTKDKKNTTMTYDQRTNHPKLRGGFKHFVIFTPYLKKIRILTHIFQMDWFNHQPSKRLRRWSLALTTFQLLLQKRFTPDNVSLSDAELDPWDEFADLPGFIINISQMWVNIYIYTVYIFIYHTWILYGTSFFPFRNYDSGNGVWGECQIFSR